MSGVGIKQYQASRAGPWLVQVFDPAIKQQQHEARAMIVTSMALSWPDIRSIEINFMAATLQ